MAELVAAYGENPATPEVEKGWQGHLYVVPPLPPDKPPRKRWLRAVKGDDLA